MALQSDSTAGLSEAELRRRLAEAEATLHAIREGEVDALVVRGPSEDQVFALGGENSYRAFMEAMDIGAAAVDASGNLIYANRALQDLLGVAAQELQQAELNQLLGSSGELVIRRLLDQSIEDRRSAQLMLQTSAGERHIEVSAAPLRLAFGQGYALTFTDVTERVETATASENERIARALLASSNEAVVVCNGLGIITQANAKVRQFHDGSSIGKKFNQAFPFSFAVSSGLIDGADLVEVALSGSSVRAVEATLVSNERTRTVLVSAGPLRSADQAIGGCIIAFDDISERKAAERKQLLLMRELTHRVKNTLTLVLSIANRTAAGANGLGDFRTAFARRLEALAATHNLLAEDFSSGLTIEEIAAAELSPYVTVGSDRVTFENLDYRLSSDAAVTLGLVLHELATNAVKYGALSNERGSISLSARASGPAVEIVWRETGGPPVLPPSRHGFGQTLILRGLGQNGASATTLDYLPEGVLCRMHVPLTSVMDAAVDQ